MYAWESIDKTLDYIENYLNEAISTETLANLAALSPFYYQRLFKRLVNRSVQDYMKLRRMSEVVNALKDKESRILDIALAYGFSDHAHFTKTFKDTYDITPAQYRETLPLLNTFERPDLASHYTLIDKNVPLIVQDIVLEIQDVTLKKNERYWGITDKINMHHQIPVGEATGIDQPGVLWDRYHDIQDHYEQLSRDVHLGISYDANPQQGVFTYFAGGKVSEQSNPIPDGFTEQIISEGNYIVCSIEAESEEKLVTVALNRALRYLFETWLPTHQIAIQPLSYEKYYRSTNQVHYMELWLKTISL